MIEGPECLVTLNEREKMEIVKDFLLKDWRLMEDWSLSVNLVVCYMSGDRMSFVGVEERYVGRRSEVVYIVFATGRPDFRFYDQGLAINELRDR